MNILFIGKWDIAGAYISDRLIREGHTACWMTSEPDRVLWNKKFKGNIYRGSWRREDYQRILKANSVDAVVYLTSTFRENYEDLPEYDSQMLDLTNLLNVLRNYPLKCLLYLSSVELDYSEIHTPVLTDLAAGEMLCEAYHTAYELPILILRMGCVYGSFGLDRMGYTGLILNKMRKREPLESLYSPASLLDVIYGEDVAVAVNQLLSLGKQGTYRLLTGHPLTMEEYFRCLGQAAGVTPEVTWRNQKVTAPMEYFLSGQETRLETGWIPFYLLQEKGVEILKRILAKAPGDKRPEEKDAFLHSLKRVLRRPGIKSFLETMVLFALTCLLLRFSTDVADLKYVDIRLMFVAIVSCLHGMRFGILSIFLACLSYVWSLTRAQVDISYLLYSVDTWVPFVVYMITGASIGYIVERDRDEKEAVQENYSLLMDKYEFLKSIHGETLEIKGNLQRQIITTKYSFGHAYEVAVELDSLKPELILLKVIKILENIMDCQKAAIFLVNSKNDHYARLKACSPALRDSISNSVNMDEFPLIYQAFHENGIFMNTELLSGYPDYASPIYYHEELICFVAVYEIGTEKFTVYFQNLFKIITSLIEKNLVKALEYENAKRDSLYYPGTELLLPKAFEDRLSIMRSECDDIVHTFILARVYPKTPLSQEEVSSRIASVIRGSDCMGIDPSGNYAVILVNMERKYLDAVKTRFERKGLLLEAEEK
ncbi:MAG: NAD(P)-dependent oxidoreductase [Candidatus Limivivens sp.]|nr:NAD(P)-dependent oxidoreductase [Candidatus Limivivens sp.]